jgi:hypothetical protein
VVRRPCAFKQRDVARAVRGAEAAGLDIGRVEIDPVTGKISIVPATEPKNDSELDRWLKGNPENARSA